MVKAIQKAMGPRMRFVFRNFPLTNAHPFAEAAAEASKRHRYQYALGRSLSGTIKTVTVETLDEAERVLATP
jgi:hypothetical protein